MPHRKDSLLLLQAGHGSEKVASGVDGSWQQLWKHGYKKARKEKPECVIENKEGFHLSKAFLTRMEEEREQEAKSHAGEYVEMSLLLLCGLTVASLPQKLLLPLCLLFAIPGGTGAPGPYLCSLVPVFPFFGWIGEKWTSSDCSLLSWLFPAMSTVLWKDIYDDEPCLYEHRSLDLLLVQKAEWLSGMFPKVV